MRQTPVAPDLQLDRNKAACARAVIVVCRLQNCIKMRMIQDVYARHL